MPSDREHEKQTFSELVSWKERTTMKMYTDHIKRRLQCSHGTGRPLFVVNVTYHIALFGSPNRNTSPSVAVATAVVAVDGDRRCEL